MDVPPSYDYHVVTTPKYDNPTVWKYNTCVSCTVCPDALLPTQVPAKEARPIYN
jgi:hypothetical protein